MTTRNEVPPDECLPKVLHKQAQVTRDALAAWDERSAAENAAVKTADGAESDYAQRLEAAFSDGADPDAVEDDRALKAAASRAASLKTAAARAAYSAHWAALVAAAREHRETGTDLVDPMVAEARAELLAIVAELSPALAKLQRAAGFRRWWAQLNRPKHQSGKFHDAAGYRPMGWTPVNVLTGVNGRVSVSAPSAIEILTALADQPAEIVKQEHKLLHAAGLPVPEGSPYVPTMVRGFDEPGA